MAHQAKIPVYMIDVSEGRITCLNDMRDDAVMLVSPDRTIMGPILVQREERHFAGHVLELHDRWSQHDFATACATDMAGQVFFLTVTSDVTEGYYGNPNTLIGQKYSFVQNALMRLLLTAKRMGLRLIMDSVTCSDLPSSRDLVNFVGASGRQIRILSPQKSRDAQAVAALALLEDQKILAVQRG